jgi:3-dehydroquinate synthase
MQGDTTSIERTITVPFAHRVYFTRSIFAPQNQLLANLLTPASRERAKVLIVIDAGVTKSFPALVESITAYFADPSCPAKLVNPPLVVNGGEAVKQSRDLVENLYQQIEAHGIDRHSSVIAIGGGALLDAVGFAAATAHRGVRHIRIPTTTLSQADGGVGVKNGINAFGKKNFIGTFAVPFAVINDSDFLATLPETEKRGGLIEAIKVALIRDAEFFAELETRSGNLATLESSAMEWVVRRCAELHVRHITESGDPFELGSARPLDFGHWAAHKLEQMSGCSLSHGAAVAIGLALDTLYSRRKGMLGAAETERIISLVQRLGFALFDPLMLKRGPDEKWLLLEGLEEFREHLGGDLTVTLLAGIGRGVEVHEIDPGLMRESIRELARRAGHPEVS